MGRIRLGKGVQGIFIFVKRDPSWQALPLKNLPLTHTQAPVLDTGIQAGYHPQGPKHRGDILSKHPVRISGVRKHSELHPRRQDLPHQCRRRTVTNPPPQRPPKGNTSVAAKGSPDTPSLQGQGILPVRPSGRTGDLVVPILCRDYQT